MFHVDISPNMHHGLAVYPPGATFSQRVLRDYEFVWIIDGNCVWHTDGEDLPAPAGTILLARKGMRDSFTWDPEQPTRHAFIHFDLSTLPAGGPPPASWPLTRRMTSGDVLRPLFRHAMWLLDQADAMHAELARGAVGYMLQAYVTGALQCKGEGRAALPMPVEKTLRAVQRLWQDGPMQSPSLNELAQEAGVSAAHLCRLFKEALGEPPIRALLYLRLERAATLLGRTNMRLQEIAEQTGFANQFHFSRAFRQVFGQSPRDFRQNMASDAPPATPNLLKVRRATSYIWDPL